MELVPDRGLMGFHLVCPKPHPCFCQLVFHGPSGTIGVSSYLCLHNKCVIFLHLLLTLVCLPSSVHIECQRISMLNQKSLLQNWSIVWKKYRRNVKQRRNWRSALNVCERSVSSLPLVPTRGHLLTAQHRNFSAAMKATWVTTFVTAWGPAGSPSPQELRGAVCHVQGSEMLPAVRHQAWHSTAHFCHLRDCGCSPLSLAPSLSCPSQTL